MAALLCLKKTPEYCLGAYFRLKDRVFVGKKPYNVDCLEAFIKDEVGEHTKVSDIKDHKLIITATLADRKPIDLFLFRSYDRLGGKDPRDAIRSANDEDFSQLPDHNALLWYALRCSSAAPIFFPPKDGFLDGGLLANNPTEDLLYEVNRYNKELKKRNEPPMQIGVLCSVGTGRKPLEKVDADNFSITMPRFTSPASFKETYDKGKVAFGSLFSSLTHTEDYITRRAEAWCDNIGIKYFRLNTQLPKRIYLDEIDDETLLDILWDAQVWVEEHRDELRELARILVRNIHSPITEVGSPLVNGME